MTLELFLKVNKFSFYRFLYKKIATQSSKRMILRIYSKKGVGYQYVAYFLSILPSFILYSGTVLNELDMLGIGIHKLVSTASMYRINEVQEHYAL